MRRLIVWNMMMRFKLLETRPIRSGVVLLRDVHA
jgi:hypothetical protein